MPVINCYFVLRNPRQREICDNLPNGMNFRFGDIGYFIPPYEFNFFYNALFCDSYAADVVFTYLHTEHLPKSLVQKIKQKEYDNSTYHYKNKTIKEISKIDHEQTFFVY